MAATATATPTPTPTANRTVKRNGNDAGGKKRKIKRRRRKKKILKRFGSRIRAKTIRIVENHQLPCSRRAPVSSVARHRTICARTSLYYYIIPRNSVGRRFFFFF